MYELHAPKMLSACRYYISDVQHAEDVMLNGFFKLFQGTTIRSFNTKTQQWKVTWFGAIQNQCFTFDVIDNKNEIILELKNNTKLKMKWIFFNMKSDSFEWRSEIYDSEYKKWFINYHMLCETISESI